MRLRSVLLNIVNIFSHFIIVVALSASSRSFAAEQPSVIPAWLRAHVGEDKGQIAVVVLQRARVLPAKSERRRCKKSLLLRHGRLAPQ